MIYMYFVKILQAHLRDILSSVSDHYKKVDAI